MESSTSAAQATALVLFLFFDFLWTTSCQSFSGVNIYMSSSLRALHTGEPSKTSALAATAESDAIWNLDLFGVLVDVGFGGMAYPSSCFPLQTEGVETATLDEGKAATAAPPAEEANLVYRVLVLPLCLKTARFMGLDVAT